MKKSRYKIRFLLTAFMFTFLFSAFSQGHQLVEKITGSWNGTLKFQGMELTLVFNISANDHDSITVLIDSPDQGAKGIPTSSAQLSKDSLIIKSKSLKGSFRGGFSAEYLICRGIWKQSGMSFPIELKHSVTAFTRNRPQEPQPPFPYIQKEVLFDNAKAGNSLAGTLTLPDEKGIFPVAILITGSGPQNRDEELMGHKPFLVIADYLTRQGIAVLRYDDRGVGRSTGKFSTATTADFASDVSAAVDFLKKQPGIDTTRIGMIGHSEGGMIAPMVASQRKDIAFVLLMAGPGLPCEQILLMQTALIAKADSASDEEIAQTLKVNKKIYKLVKKNPDNAKATLKIRKILLAEEKHSSTGKNAPEATSEADIDAQIQNVISPWFRYFLTFNPVTYLTKVRCPLLAINGSLDLQVPPKEDLEAIEKAMIFGGNSHYTIEEIPGLNHLFQTATTGNPAEYSKIEETISPKALEIMGNWIGKVTK
jgi:uncharacterized protein